MPPLRTGNWHVSYFPQGWQKDAAGLTTTIQYGKTPEKQVFHNYLRMKSKSAFLFKFVSNSEIIIINHITPQGLRNGRGRGL